MNRLALSLIVIVSVAVSVISLSGMFLPHEMMMSRMMGKREETMLNLLWPVLMLASTGIILVVAGYTLAFPSIRYASGSAPKAGGSNIVTVTPQDPMDIVMRVVKPDERTALQLLKTRGGICLQKDITNMTGLGKLKTHRIVARLAERGIVEVKKAGNTNQISVPAWLKISHNGATAANS